MLEQRSLREQVYDFIKEEMEKGHLLPGATINTTQLATMLGISKTPLRDALIQLMSEGFVDILPRKGFKVAVLSLKDIKDLYELIGCLEGRIISLYFNSFSSETIDQLERINQKIKIVIQRNDFESYFKLNLSFHNTFIDFCHNKAIKKILEVSKRRLYDFPRRTYIKEWELSNCQEHGLFIEALRQADPDEAVRIIRDVHWGFGIQEKQIRKFYFEINEEIKKRKKP